MSHRTPKPLTEPTIEPIAETTTNHDRGPAGRSGGGCDAIASDAANATSARPLAALWRAHFGRNATPAQIAALRVMVDAEIPAGMAGLTAACVRYAAEQGKPFDYLRGVFRGCLARRQYPDTPRETAPAGQPMQAPATFRRPAAVPPQTDMAERQRQAEAHNRRQMARAGIDYDRLLALLTGPNRPADEADVFANPGKYGVAIMANALAAAGR